MVRLMLFFSCAFCLSFSFAQTYRWPTDFSTADPQIGFNYGVNEEVGVASDFHQGIDIKCVSGQEMIYAVEDGKIIKLQMGNDPTQVDIFFQTTSGKIFGYGHVIEAVGGFNLYSGSQPSSNNFITTPSGTIAKGTVIATTSSSSTAGSTVGYDHCHFIYYDSNIGDDESDAHLIRNPLSLDYAPVLTVKDPTPSTGNSNDSKPRLGPLRIMKEFNGSQQQPNISYISCSLTPYVYGKIDFTKEITDDLGYVAPKSGGSNGFSWCNTVNPKIESIRGIPFMIKYYIKGINNTQLTWNDDPHGEYIFNGAPLQSQVATNKLFLYDGGGGESINSLNPAASYNFILSNLIYNGSVGEIEDRYWNTRLKSTAGSYSGSSASINDDAKYPDGKYKIHTEAEDIRGAISNVWQEDEVVIDNFAPYLKTCTITSNAALSNHYNANWVWTGTNLVLLPQVSSPFDRIIDPISPAPGTDVTITLVFSEPMQGTPVVTVPLMSTLTITGTNPSNDKKSFEYTFSTSGFPQNTGGLYNIKVTGLDLAGNNLLRLSNFTGTYSSLTYRDNNGNWANTNTPMDYDNCHYFNVQCINGNRLAGSSGRSTSSCMDADFTAHETSGTDDDMHVLPGGFVHFTDATAPTPATWLWDFGDGSISTSQNPTHQYTQPGIYNVKLTAYSGNDSDVELKNDFITVDDPNAVFNVDFTASSYSVLSGQAINLTSTCTGLAQGASFDWDVEHAPGAFTPYSTASPSGITMSGPSNAGGSEVTLTVTSGANTGSKTKYINVYGSGGGGPLQVSVATATQPQPGAFPTLYNFTASVNFGTPPHTLLYWNYGDGVTDNLGEHTYQSDGTYDVTVTYIDASGGGPVTSAAYSLTVGPAVTITTLDFTFNQFTNVACQNNIGSDDLEFNAICNTTIGSCWDVEFRWIITNTTGPGSSTWGFLQGLDELDIPLNEGIYNVQLQARYSGSTAIVSSPIKQVSVCSPSSNFISSFTQAAGVSCFNPQNWISNFISYNFSASTPLFSAAFMSVTHNFFCPNLNGPGQGGTTTYQEHRCTNPSDNCFNEQKCFNTLGYFPPTIPFISTGGGGFFIELDYAPQYSNWNTTGPTAVTFTLKVHVNQDLNNDHFFDVETKSFTVNVIKCLSTATINAGGNKNVCPGGQVILGGNPTCTGGNNPTYEWTITNGGTGSIVNPTSANPVFIAGSAQIVEVKLKVTDPQYAPNGVTEIIYIDVSNVAPDAGPDLVFCEGTSNRYLFASASGGSQNYTYQWSVASGTSASLSCLNCPIPSIIPNSAGITTVTLHAIDPSGCVGTDDVIIDFRNDYPYADAGSDITGLCPGPIRQLTGTATNASGSYLMEWYKAGEPLSITCSSTLQNTLPCSYAPLSATSYVFRVTDQVSGCMDEDVVNIIPDQSQSPIITAGPDVYICCTSGQYQGGMQGLVLSGIATYTFEWLNSQGLHLGSTPFTASSNNHMMIVINPGIYTFKITDQAGCISTDEVEVFKNYLNNPSPHSVIPICSSDNAALSAANVSGGYPPFIYQWSNPSLLNDFSSITTTTSNLTTDALFNLTITDSKNCVYNLTDYRYVLVYSQTQDPTLNMYAPQNCEAFNSGDEDACIRINNNVQYTTTLPTAFGSYNPSTDAFSSALSSTGNCTNCPTTEEGTAICLSYTTDGTKTVTYSLTTPCGTRTVTQNFNVNPTVIINDMYDSYFGTSSTMPPSLTAMNIEGSPNNSGGIVNSWDYVYFAAGTAIDLLPGFEIENGAEFYGEIIPCAHYSSNFVQDSLNPPSDQDTSSQTGSTIADVGNPPLRQENKQEGTKETFSVYPNPTTGNILIDVAFEKETEAVVVIEDLLGHAVAKIDKGKINHKIYKFNLRRYNLEEGVYLIRLLYDGTSKNKRVVYIKN